MKTNYTVISTKKRGKRDDGECFTYQFVNGDTFLGIVLCSELNIAKWGDWFNKTAIVLFFKNKLNDLELVDERVVKSILSDCNNLAIPPRIVDYGGWNFGYYKPLLNIDPN